MSVTTRRDRREHEKRKKRPQQGRRVGGSRGGGGWLAAAIVAGVLVLGIFGLRALGVFEPPPPPIDLGAGNAPKQDEVVGTKQPDEGSGHIDVGQRATYRTNPPTSGPHWPLPHAGWGVKDTAQEDERTVHNLEHGGIVISHNGLASEDVGRLKTLVRQLNGTQFPKVLLQPYPRLTDAKIAATAWHWSLKLAAYDETALIKFVRAHYGPSGEAPEPTAQ